MYQNITISGLPGAGSTTLLQHLKLVLKDEGWRGFSGGEFMRAYATEKGYFDPSAGGHHDATVYSDAFDREVDMDMRNKLLTEKKWVLESWLSGFLAQQVPGVLKVLMVCSNKAVRIDRIVNRDAISPDLALANMNNRYEKNLKKWQRVYAQEWQDWVVAPNRVKSTDPIDFWRQDLYDVVIDTYSVSQLEATNIVLNAIKSTQ